MTYPGAYRDEQAREEHVAEEARALRERFMAEDMADLRKRIVADILDTRDEFEIRRAVEEYVESWTDDTVREWAKDL